MLNRFCARSSAALICATAAATIAGAWAFEYAGYVPCDLCYKQRWVYYTAIPLAAVIAFAAPARPWAARMGLYLLAALWLFGMAFGVYHAGIEWKWWPGPATCVASGGLTGLPDLTKPVVLCDEPAIRILGLSLAGWNAAISLALAALALAGARSQGSSSVSQ
jgi:disulfide bond formation protein DsbB